MDKLDTGLEARGQAQDAEAVEVQERARGLQYIKVTPEFDRYHADSRYKAILQQMGLPE